MLHFFGRRICCAPNLIISNVFAPACQECLIFQMNFDDSYLSSISLILHRCSRAMNCMVLRTWRSCMDHNVYDPRSMLNILLFAHVRCFKMLLLANVWATFLKCSEKCERQILTIFVAIQILYYISIDFH